MARIVAAAEGNLGLGARCVLDTVISFYYTQSHARLTTPVTVWIAVPGRGRSLLCGAIGNEQDVSPARPLSSVLPAMTFSNPPESLFSHLTGNRAPGFLNPVLRSNPSPSAWKGLQDRTPLTFIQRERPVFHKTPTTIDTFGLRYGDDGERADESKCFPRICGGE